MIRLLFFTFNMTSELIFFHFDALLVVLDVKFLYRGFVGFSLLKDSLLIGSDADYFVNRNKKTKLQKKKSCKKRKTNKPTNKKAKKILSWQNQPSQSKNKCNNNKKKTTTTITSQHNNNNYNQPAQQQQQQLLILSLSYQMA